MCELSLAQRVLQAADAIEEVARMKGHTMPEMVAFSAKELRREVKFWNEA